ncbi:MAG: Glu/Leu/Phe/Val dehydrogenase dimerization domain-containing protein [Bacillota bacterium]
MAGYFGRMESLGFEELIMVHDSPTGLKAVIAIHSTLRGPALGGTRMWAYPSEEAAVEDVLRLARGMTFKAAAAELSLGGGKAVIMGDPGRDKSKALFQAYGRFVDRLQGRFLTAEDMGTCEQDLDWVRAETAHVIGGSACGSPSPYTAYGVWRGMKAAAAAAFGSASLSGLVVAVQGLGGVGSCLCRYLAEEGAALIVTDLDAARAAAAAKQWGARVVKAADIYAQKCDIFAPCGVGAIINAETIPLLQCRIVAGAANNVLLEEADGVALHHRGILYAPDYIINAGGLIFVDACRRGAADSDQVYRDTGRIEGRLARLFHRAAGQGLTPEAAAALLVEENMRKQANSEPEIAP